MAAVQRKRSSIYQLKPDIPFVCTPYETVSSVLKKMANKRVHCVIVMTNIEPDGDPERGGLNGKFVGLFTSKDLTFRVVGEGLDPDKTIVEDIMTKSAYCLHMETPTTEALKFMVERSIRHLPLLDDFGSIRGVIDITRCFYQAMLRLERISTNAKKLKEILTDVEENYEDLKNIEAERILNDINSLTTLIEVPTIQSVLDEENTSNQAPIYIRSNNTVHQAAMLMIKHNKTALLVQDETSSSKNIIGIFTSKDICFRVLSKGYNSDICTVAKVLTSSPEFAKPHMNIGEALRLMYQGHFLNLPIIDDSDKVIGMVSVLQLIYSALKQLGQHDINMCNSPPNLHSSYDVNDVYHSNPKEPVWDKFWNSLDKTTDDIESLETSVNSGRISPNTIRPEIYSRTPDLSRIDSINNIQMSLSTNSRRSSLNKIQRIHSSESLSRSSFYLKKKSVTFKVKSTGERTHKISVIINDRLTIDDDIQVLKLIKNEISQRIRIMNYDVFFLNHNSNQLSIIENETDLMKAIDLSEENDEVYVTLVIEKKHSSFSFQALWKAVSTSFHRAVSHFTSPALPTSIALLSVGVLMGFTLSKIIK